MLGHMNCGYIPWNLGLTNRPNISMESVPPKSRILASMAIDHEWLYVWSSAVDVFLSCFFLKTKHSLQSGGPVYDSVQLVQITPITMELWFMVLITIVVGAFVNQLITRGPHIVDVRQLVICSSNKWSETKHGFHLYKHFSFKSIYDSFCLTNQLLTVNIWFIHGQATSDWYAKYGCMVGINS